VCCRRATILIQLDLVIAVQDGRIVVERSETAHAVLGLRTEPS